MYSYSRGINPWANRRSQPRCLGATKRHIFGAVARLRVFAHQRDAAILSSHVQSNPGKLAPISVSSLILRSQNRCVFSEIPREKGKSTNKLENKLESSPASRVFPGVSGSSTLELEYLVVFRTLWEFCPGTGLKSLMGRHSLKDPQVLGLDRGLGPRTTEATGDRPKAQVRQDHIVVCHHSILARGPGLKLFPCPAYLVVLSRLKGSSISRAQQGQVSRGTAKPQTVFVKMCGKGKHCFILRQY